MPWSQLHSNPDSLVDKKYLPVGAQLQDPSRMVQADIDLVYSHWFNRQKEGQRALRFLAGEKNNGKNPKESIRTGKKVMQKYIDLDEDTDGPMGQGLPEEVAVELFEISEQASSDGALNYLSLQARFSHNILFAEEDVLSLNGLQPVSSNVQWEVEPLKSDFGLAPKAVGSSYDGKKAFLLGLCHDKDYVECVESLSKSKVSWCI